MPGLSMAPRKRGFAAGPPEKAGLRAATPRPVVYGRQSKEADGLFSELRDLAHAHEFERSLSLCLQPLIANSLSRLRIGDCR